MAPMPLTNATTSGLGGDDTSRRSETTALLIASEVGFGVLAVLMAICICILYKKSRRYRKQVAKLVRENGDLQDKLGKRTRELEDANKRHSIAEKLKEINTQYHALSQQCPTCGSKAVDSDSLGDVAKQESSGTGDRQARECREKDAQKDGAALESAEAAVTPCERRSFLDLYRDVLTFVPSKESTAEMGDQKSEVKIQSPRKSGYWDDIDLENARSNKDKGKPIPERLDVPISG